MSIVSTGSKILSQDAKAITSGRFDSKLGKITRTLNKMAIEAQKADSVVYTYPKATPEDYIRLTSEKMEDAYKRVTWTNPKDKKVYHILADGRKNGLVHVRILDSEGAFVKNAELEPKTIVVFDNFYSPRGITHGEIMETFVKRFNPFANVERLEHKKGLYEIIRYRGKNPMHLEAKRFGELANKIEKGKKVDYISISEAHLVDAEDVMRMSGEKQLEYVRQSQYIGDIEPIFRRISSSGARIFEAAGNERNYAKELVSDRLAIDGVEGVGSITNGTIAKDSCSRNSIFTQHYEQRNYSARLVRDENGKPFGVNITGLNGVDFPLNRKTVKLIDRHFGGTSYAVPVRVAKLSLAEMMEKANL